MAGEARMSRPDEGVIHAWLDGELEPAEAARVKRLSETEPEWAAAVAEARGLIAASSRIVRALDAVPGGVIPSGNARAPMAARSFRVRPWMGIAAGLVLVVGTAYVMRESTQEAFGPPPSPPVAPVASQRAATETSAPERQAPVQNAPVPATTGERRETPAAPREQSVGPLRQLADDARRDAAGAGSTGTVGVAAPLPAQPAPTAIAPATTAPPSAPVAAAKSAAEEDRSLARARLSADRLSQVVTTASRGPAEPVVTLAGCWRANAPDSLAALYRDLPVMRVAGDTLVLLLPRTLAVVVVRDGDTLRGALTAVREVCPPRP